MHYYSLSACVVVGLLGLPIPAMAQSSNQTEELSSVQRTGLPFRIEVRRAPIEFEGLPGLHSGCAAIYEDQPEHVLFFGGRYNLAGMHGFECGDGSFAKDDYNRSFYVANVQTGEVWERSVDDPRSGLSSEQADQLSAVNFLENQVGQHLIALGGYGYSRDADDWVTFDQLALIDIAGAVEWTMGAKSQLSESITFMDPPSGAPDTIYTVTGGKLLFPEDEMWICMGQEFQGRYDVCDPDAATQTYKENFYRLRFDLDAKGEGSFTYLGESAQANEAFAHRRDLNILPFIEADGITKGAVALAGVFTEEDGCWTVPSLMHADGTMTQADPSDPETFKQGYNIYSSAAMTIWSEKDQVNYFLLGGGISYELLTGGQFVVPGGFPYSSNLSIVRYEPGTDDWSQYFANASFPRIPGGESGDAYWRFGTETYLFPVAGSLWETRSSFLTILDLDSITESTVIGYLYGGIAALGDDFGAPGFTTIASPYAFELVLIPGPGCPADLSGDGQVNGRDLAMMVGTWGQLPIGSSAPEDLNDDGWVSSIDLLMLIESWGPCSN